ncbi:MAG: nucleotidyltransferase domain-containing protein [Deltaproteobacteria bacterium]|nr:nucleotidyltransferase domain-containing protein [Deltaproteobacteria bacterium]
MPVRSLNSSVLKWPDLRTVDMAIRKWAKEELKKHEGVQLLGYFGSYAQGNWGVGSDLDIVAILSSSSEPFERRNLNWDLSTLPVPAELIVYTEKEWRMLKSDNTRFVRMLAQKTVWIHVAEKV